MSQVRCTKISYFFKTDARRAAFRQAVIKGKGKLGIYWCREHRAYHIAYGKGGK